MRRLGLVVLAAAAAFAAAVVVVVRSRHEARSDERVVSERPLETMTRDELYELARERDIAGRSKMKKSELLAALSRE
jgi:hypothetical protein